MNQIQPIVYTRPFCVGAMDYCYFVFPECLSELKNIVDPHIRNVLATDGYRGNIKNRRWHVLRIADKILLGIATEEFQKTDETGRPIRGYYGLVFPADKAMLPSIEVFKALDRDFVVPLFYEKQRFAMPISTNLESGIYVDSEEYSLPEKKGNLDFNFDSGKIKFHGEYDASIPDLLSAALFAGQTSSAFELIIGLNKRKHALEHPIQNVVCFEQTEPVILPYTNASEHADRLSARSQATPPNRDNLGKIYNNGDIESVPYAKKQGRKPDSSNSIGKTKRNFSDIFSAFNSIIEPLYCWWSKFCGEKNYSSQMMDNIHNEQEMTNEHSESKESQQNETVNYGFGLQKKK